MCVLFPFFSSEVYVLQNFLGGAALMSFNNCKILTSLARNKFKKIVQNLVCFSKKTARSKVLDEKDKLWYIYPNCAPFRYKEQIKYT